MKRFVRVALVVAAAIVPVAASAAPAPAAAVLARRFVGTYIEDIDVVRSGPFANFLVMTQGDGIYGAPLSARGTGALRKLVDYRGILTALPRGLAYLDDERAFAVVDGASCTDLVIFDAATGRFVERRPIQQLTDVAPDYCEGLARIPDGSPDAGDLLLAANRLDGSAAPRLDVLQPDGTVVKEIIPSGVSGDMVLSAVFANESGDIIAGVDGALDSGNAQLWQIDFDGSVGQRVTLNQGFVEGVAREADGKFLVTGDRSEVHAYDASLQPLASGDRDYQLGLGWISPRGIAWDDAAGEFKIDASHVAGDVALLAVTPAIDAATDLAPLAGPPLELQPASLAYVSGDAPRVGVASGSGPIDHRGIYLFDGGTYTEQVQLESLAKNERPSRVDYLPATGEFVVGFRGTTVPGVRVYSRTGAFVRAFDPRPDPSVIILAIAAFPAADGSDHLLFLFSNDQALVTDASGNQIADGFNWRTTLGLMEPSDAAYLSGGPYAGAFAVTEGSPGSVTMFRLP